MCPSPPSKVPTAPCPHPALVCHDILCTVFEQLVASEQAWYGYDPALGDANSWYARRADATRRRTLARCARVCKAFFVPAIAILWRDVDNLSPLVSAIQSAASLHPASQVSSCPSRFAESGTRASLYAHSIRSVHGFGKHLQPLELDFLNGLAAQGSEQFPLLPQLRHLRWIQSVPSGTQLLQIVPHSLQSLHLIIRKSPEWRDTVALRSSPSEYKIFIQDLLKSVAARAPRLRYIRISAAGDVHESSLEPMCCLSSLETVDFLERVYWEVTTSPLLRPLASLPKLQHLKLRLPEEIHPVLGASAFPSLQTLTVDAMFAPLTTVSEFLSIITSQHVRSLIIQNCECNTAGIGAKLYDLCSVVRVRFSGSLRELELSLRGFGPLPLTDTHPLIRTVEPLLEMHDLDDVRITIAPDVAVVPGSEHDLETMAKAWPKASRLHLSYFPSTACPSLEDIEGLAHHCSGVSDLILPGIDASMTWICAQSKQEPESGVPGDAKRTTRTGRHRLRSLCLSDNGWNSRIPDPMHLARFLDGLFPDVEWRCPPLASDHWRETIQEVLNLRLVRMLREDTPCAAAVA